MQRAGAQGSQTPACAAKNAAFHPKTERWRRWKTERRFIRVKGGRSLSKQATFIVKPPDFGFKQALGRLRWVLNSSEESDVRETPKGLGLKAKAKRGGGFCSRFLRNFGGVWGKCRKTTVEFLSKKHQPHDELLVLKFLFSALEWMEILGQD